MMKDEQDQNLQQAEMQALKKYDVLIGYLRDQGSLAVAFSGGVDSTLLLYAAKEALGEQAIAVTIRSHSFPERERKEAQEFCESFHIRQFVVESEELKIEGFARNPVNRCYICKKELFHRIIDLADELQIHSVAEGSNMDDSDDYRPGMQAVKELGVLSPLRTAKLTKQEIRLLSRKFGLPTWNKQSFACLASRFVYGERITEKKLDMVNAAEELLLQLGFHQLRVRIHGENLARIEVMPDEFPMLLEHREEITQKLHAAGFTYIAMDLTGYRTGSMNEMISEKKDGEAGADSREP